MASGFPQTAEDSSRVAAVFDLDHTITSCDTFQKFLQRVAVRRPARWHKFAPLPFSIAMKKLGMRDNHWLKEQALGAVAGGLNVDDLAEHAESINADLLSNHVRPGARPAIDAHLEQGHRLILASASFDFYLEALASRLGFSEVVCTRAEFDSADKLTGKIVGRNCYGIEKLRRLEQLFGPSRGEWKVFFYSDHCSDLPVLEWADEGYAVHPEKRLGAVAQERGLAILDWD